MGPDERPNMCSKCSGQNLGLLLRSLGFVNHICQVVCFKVKVGGNDQREDEL